MNSTQIILNENKTNQINPNLISNKLLLRALLCSPKLSAQRRNQFLNLKLIDVVDNEKTMQNKNKARKNYVLNHNFGFDFEQNNSKNNKIQQRNASEQQQQLIVLRRPNRISRKSAKDFIQQGLNRISRSIF